MIAFRERLKDCSRLLKRVFGIDKRENLGSVLASSPLGKDPSILFFPWSSMTVRKIKKLCKHDFFLNSKIIER